MNNIVEMLNSIQRSCVALVLFLDHIGILTDEEVK